MRSLMKHVLLLGNSGAAAPTASFTVTTTAPNQTLTINSLGVSASTTVDWGDGSTNDYTGTAQRTHQYAAAGNYIVRFMQPELVTVFDIRDNKVTLNSADVKLCVNIQTAVFVALKAGTFNSADVSDWRPTTFYMYSMPTGYAGTFDSADVSDWRPTDFRLLSMPAGYAGTFDSADVSDWRPAYFQLYSMPAGYGGTFNSADVSAWRPTSFWLYAMPAGYAGTFDSADVSDWRPTTFYMYSMPTGYAGTFDSADVSAWRPTDFRLYLMPSGYAGTFDSADVSDWRPTDFRLLSMPAGYAGTFDSADVSDWRPAYFRLYSMPAGYTFVISAGGFAGWITTTNFQVQGNALSQAQVDQVLADFWTGFATRTATAGTINLGGSNAAPSGTLQAANPPTTGKEYAYCLVNDPDNVNPTKKWATVTITA